jgi:hypothetical protein
MLAEMIKAIVGLADERRQFRTLVEPDTRHMKVMNPDGSLERLEIPSFRNYQAIDLPSLVSLLGLAEGPRLVFVGACEDGVSVMCYLDELDRKETVRMTVEYSQAYAAFVKLNDWQKQKLVVTTLRDQLFGSTESGLLGKLRSLDFTRRNDGTKTIEHGRESMGRSIELAVQSKNGEIPEKVTFRIPMFASRDFSKFIATCDCSLDLDASMEAIRFVPTGDQLESAIEYSILHVADTIREGLDAAGLESTVVLGAPL